LILQAKNKKITLAKKIKLDWSWKFLGGTKSNLIEAGNSLAARNQT
jgi:hypothetical protein